MPEYLDDNGNPIAAPAATQAPTYLDENGEPVVAAKTQAPPPKQNFIHDPPSGPWRFWTAAKEPIVGAAESLYATAVTPATGQWENFLASIGGPGAVFLKRAVVAPAVDQLKESYSDSQQERYSEAVGHSVAAAIPFVGPWAAQVGELEGKETGSGDYWSAAGTAAGNAALALVPKAFGKGYEALKATSEGIRKGAQRLVGTGTSAVRESVANTATGAAEARQSAIDANKAADEKYLGRRGRTDKLNEARQAKHEERTRSAEEATKMDRGKVDEANEKIREKNRQARSAADAATEKERAEIDRKNAEIEKNNVQGQVNENKRRIAQSDLNTDSHEMLARVETAREKSLAEGNQKFSTVNESLNELPVDDDVMKSAVGDAQLKIKGSQANPSVMKDIQNRIENGVKFNYKDLQGYYSELGTDLSKGNLQGDVYTALDTLHEAIGKEMQKIADTKGMGGQLTAARNYWRRMKQTFGKPPSFADNASDAVRTANADFMRQHEYGNQVRLLGLFDPEIPKVAERIAKHQETIKSLGTPKAPQELIPYPEPKGAGDVTPAKPYPEPHPTPTAKEPLRYKEPPPQKAIEVPEVNTRFLRAKLLDRWTKGESTLHQWQVRALLSGGVGGVVGMLAGHGVGLEAGAAASAGAYALGPAVITKIIEMPAVREWLTRPPTGELVTLRSLPDADRIRISDGLRQVATAAKAQGVPVSKLLMAVLTGASSQSHQK